MNYYVLITSCAFLLLGLFWGKKSMLDIAIKAVVFSLGVWGLVLRFGVNL